VEKREKDVEERNQNLEKEKLNEMMEIKDFFQRVI